VKLIPGAGALWRKLWSVRLALLSALLSAVELALPYVAPSVPSRMFAAAALLVALAAGVARLVSQPALNANTPT